MKPAAVPMALLMLALLVAQDLILITGIQVLLLKLLTILYKVLIYLLLPMLIIVQKLLLIM